MPPTASKYRQADVVEKAAAEGGATKASVAGARTCPSNLFYHLPRSWPKSEEPRQLTSPQRGSQRRAENLKLHFRPCRSLMSLVWSWGHPLGCWGPRSSCSAYFYTALVLTRLMEPFTDNSALLSARVIQMATTFTHRAPASVRTICESTVVF